MALPASITDSRALTLEEVGVLVRAVKPALYEAWMLLYGTEPDLGHPVVGELKRNGLPGAVLICRGTASVDTPEAWFRVEIISQPNPDDTD